MSSELSVEAAKAVAEAPGSCGMLFGALGARAFTNMLAG